MTDSQAIKLTMLIDLIIAILLAIDVYYTYQMNQKIKG